jgi:oligosaccharyltransferase complex subunit gamma
MSATKRPPHTINMRVLSLLVLLVACCAWLSGSADAARSRTKSRVVDDLFEKLHEAKPKKFLSDAVVEDLSSAAAKQLRATKLNNKLERSDSRNAKHEKKMEERLGRADRLNAQHKSSRTRRVQTRESKKQEKFLKKDKYLKKKSEATTPKVREASIRKLKFLLRQTERSASNMISLDYDAYIEYVNGGPRPYFLYLSYTAISPQNRCAMCRVAHDAMILLAQGYFKENKEANVAYLAHLEAGGDFDDPAFTQPVFFVEADIARCRRVFEELNMQSAPTILIAPPKISTSNPRSNLFLSSIKSKYKFNSLSPTLQPEELNSQLLKITGVDVNIERPVPFMLLVLIASVGVLGLFAVYKYFSLYLVLRKQSMLFFGLGLVAYLFCISGGMFNIIRNTPFAGEDHNGDVSYIHGGNRNQYGVEGYIMGSVEVGCGLALVMLTLTAFYSADDKKRKWYNKTAMIFTWPLTLAAIFAFFWSILLVIYTKKNGSYRYGFVRD